MLIQQGMLHKELASSFGFSNTIVITRFLYTCSTERQMLLGGQQLKSYFVIAPHKKKANIWCAIVILVKTNMFCNSKLCSGMQELKKQYYEFVPSNIRADHTRKYKADGGT